MQLSPRTAPPPAPSHVHRVRPATPQRLGAPLPALLLAREEPLELAPSERGVGRHGAQHVNEVCYRHELAAAAFALLREQAHDRVLDRVPVHAHCDGRGREDGVGGGGRDARGARRPVDGTRARTLDGSCEGGRPEDGRRGAGSGGARGGGAGCSGCSDGGRLLNAGRAEASERRRVGEG